MASFSFHFQRRPEHIPEVGWIEYRSGLAMACHTSSRSHFKPRAYGLRETFRHIGQGKRVVNQPSLKNDTRMHIILKPGGLKQQFKFPAQFRHQVDLFGRTLESGGLRPEDFRHPLGLQNNPKPICFGFSGTSSQKAS